MVSIFSKYTQMTRARAGIQTGLSISSAWKGNYYDIPFYQVTWHISISVSESEDCSTAPHKTVLTLK